MNKIHLMNENLANKIAAGEIIEKCSSVVKELVENSIDALATTIKVDLIDGGVKEIKVTDDGMGMNKEDAVLSFERHSTSKLLKEEDLFFINTLGFRGEALPSIASVSEVELKTCADEIGTTVHIKGGKTDNVFSSDSRRGTQITVKNLFYNTPARLKYLKSEQTELSNCINYVERIALSHPNIKFSLTNNEKMLLNTSGSDDLLRTIHEIYGMEVSSKMIHIHSSNDDYEIEGYISKPELLKSNRNHMITIVNGRVIKNNDLNKFINDAYYTYKPDIKYPVIVLNVLTDPTLIDVNVHPTKQDIKFSKIEELRSLVINTIKDALYHTLLIPEINISKENNEEFLEILEHPIIHNYEEITKPTENLKVKEEQTTFNFSNVEEKNKEIKNLELYLVGIALGTYIIAQNDNGIYLIDQHAAQERINYEKYLKVLKESKVNTTSMLIPVTLEFSPSEFIALKDNIEVLNKLGVELEEFGINTFIFKTHPTWLKEGYEEESIRKITELVIQMSNNFNDIKFRESVAITLACKMSIKANQSISNEAAENILSNLVKCDNPYNCPHGRPTIISFTNYELEKMFKRVMN